MSFFSLNEKQYVTNFHFIKQQFTNTHIFCIGIYCPLGIQFTNGYRYSIIKAAKENKMNDLNYPYFLQINIFINLTLKFPIGFSA
jgi:hypothetical protein